MPDLVRYASLFIIFLITFYLASLAILAPAFASELSLLAPAEVDVCAPELYSLRFASSTAADSLWATVKIPTGFSLAGETAVISGEGRSSARPSVRGQSLTWDLSEASRSCRHIVINEWEQNPRGPDSGKEWIELYNPSSLEIDFSGWRLVDSYYGKTVSIPAGTAILPGGYLVVTWGNGSLINSRPTSISLFDSAGKEVDRTLEAADEEDDDRCYARYPDGKDGGVDLDWRFQASTKGCSNGGSFSDIYAGEILMVLFNLTAGCSATSGQALSAEVRTSGGTFLAEPHHVGVRRADLSISLTPNLYEAALGDAVTWSILLENTGNGTAYGLQVNDTIGSGLQLLSIDSPGQALSWSYATLAPGANAEVRLKARATSSQDEYSNTVRASWGCGPCQNLTRTSLLGARTALRKEPDGPRSVAVGEQASFKISADLPRGARNLWINDTIPKGLIYDRSSLSVRGLAPWSESEIHSETQGEVLSAREDGSQPLSWFFGDVGPAQKVEIAYSARLANTPENQDGVVLEGTPASMSWKEGPEQGQGPEQKTDNDGAGDLTVAEPDLVLEKQSSQSFVGNGGDISYTLALYHSAQSHVPAFDVDLEDILPPALRLSPGSVQVLSGPRATSDASGLRWHFDAIDTCWNSSRKVLIKYNASSTALPGEVVANSARVSWTSLAGEDEEERTGQGGLNDYLRRASWEAKSMGLSISKRAEPDPVEVGGVLGYTLTYENQGGGTASEVTITDWLDPRLSFISSDPPPLDGTNNVWKVPRLEQDGPHPIVIKARVRDDLEDGVMLANSFSMESREIGPQNGIIYTRVSNGTRLDVNKTALQKAVRRGEEVGFVIRVCNRGGLTATNVTVRDVFDRRVEFVSAWPPQESEGLWRFGSIAPGECVEMGLTVRVPRLDAKFECDGHVRGAGFVRIYSDYTTSREPTVITNQVFVVSDQMEKSASASVKVLGEEGTDLHIREHGSGDYEDREALRFLAANRSIRLCRSGEASYRPTEFALPGNGSQRFYSLWSQECRARNGITGTSFAGQFRYATRLAGRSLFDLDENGSRLEVEANLEGMAHLGTLKRPFNSTASGEEISLQEEYAGDFGLRETIDDLGGALGMERSVSGSGYAASDTRVGDRQRSYQSGAGVFRSLEQVQTYEGFMAKDLEAASAVCSLRVSPRTTLRLSQSWREGTWSRSASSVLSEEILEAARLKKKATAASLSEMESETSFSGIARFRTAYGKTGLSQVDQDETLMGDFRVARKTILSGAAKYDQPHLSLQKDGRLEKDAAFYNITVTNDGCAALAPLILRDLFPPGARFLNATLRPSQLSQNGSNWTLIHLAIGDTLRIGICLDIIGCEGDIINRAEAAGNCSLGRAVARNLSVIQRAWLGNCTPAMQKGAPSTGLRCTCEETEEEITGAEIAGAESADADRADAEEEADKTEYFDPVLPLPAGEGEDSCPLSCAPVEKAHESVKAGATRDSPEEEH